MNTQVVPVLIATALMLGAPGCKSAFRVIDGPRVETFSIFDDGMRLRLAPDIAPGIHCAGANVRWVGNDVYITLVSARDGLEVEASHPSYLSENGARYIFIPEEHVPSGAWVTAYLDVGFGPEECSRIQRPRAYGPFPLASAGNTGSVSSQAVGHGDEETRDS